MDFITRKTKKSTVNVKKFKKNPHLSGFFHLLLKGKRLVIAQQNIAVAASIGFADNAGALHRLHNAACAIVTNAKITLNFGD